MESTRGRSATLEPLAAQPHHQLDVFPDRVIRVAAGTDDLLAPEEPERAGGSAGMRDA